MWLQQWVIIFILPDSPIFIGWLLVALGVGGGGGLIMRLVAIGVVRVSADAVAVAVVVVVAAMGHNFHFRRFPIFDWMAVCGSG